MGNEKHEVDPFETAQGEQTEDESRAGVADGAEDDRDISIEDLVPGLEDEIGRQLEDEKAALIAELEQERDELRDRWTRALAEAENVRKRAERDRKDAETYGGTRLARDLLTVHDNLDRALKAADDNLREQAKSFIEGVELTQRELLQAFSKHKIEKITPDVGEKFDPNRHEAMFEAPIPGAEPGTIIEAMQDGFMIADRLLRPAMVGVARAMPAEATAEPDNAVTDQSPDETADDSSTES